MKKKPNRALQPTLYRTWLSCDVGQLNRQNKAQIIGELMRPPYILSLMLLIVMAGQSLLGLFFPDLYRDLGYVRSTWFGNDLITLVLGAPLLAIGLLFEKRSFVIGRLLWLGALGYGVYNYSFYLFGAALNAFLPIYIVAFLLSVVALIFALLRTNVGEVAARFDPRTPTRLIGGYLVFVAIGLTLVWLVIWGAHIFGGQPTPGEPETFKLVAALDLTLMVPALVSGGILLWHRHPLGYVIAAIAGIQGSLYLVVLTVNGALFVLRGLTDAPGEFPIWGVLALATSVSTVLLLANVSGRWQGG